MEAVIVYNPLEISKHLIELMIFILFFLLPFTESKGQLERGGKVNFEYNCRDKILTIGECIYTLRVCTEDSLVCIYQQRDSNVYDLFHKHNNQIYFINNLVFYEFCTFVKGSDLMESREDDFMSMYWKKEKLLNIIKLTENRYLKTSLLLHENFKVSNHVKFDVITIDTIENPEFFLKKQTIKCNSFDSLIVHYKPCILSGTDSISKSLSVNRDPIIFNNTPYIPECSYDEKTNSISFKIKSLRKKDLKRISILTHWEGYYPSNDGVYDIKRLHRLRHKQAIFIYKIE